MDHSLPVTSVHGILQARKLQWVAVPFSEDLPNPEIEPGSPTMQADSLSAELSGKHSRVLQNTEKYLETAFLYGPTNSTNNMEMTPSVLY